MEIFKRRKSLSYGESSKKTQFQEYLLEQKSCWMTASGPQFEVLPYSTLYQLLLEPGKIGDVDKDLYRVLRIIH